jgi:hypothetical protein
MELASMVRLFAGKRNKKGRYYSYALQSAEIITRIQHYDPRPSQLHARHERLQRCA